MTIHTLLINSLHSWIMGFHSDTCWMDNRKIIANTGVRNKINGLVRQWNWKGKPLSSTHALATAFATCSGLYVHIRVLYKNGYWFVHVYNRRKLLLSITNYEYFFIEQVNSLIMHYTAIANVRKKQKYGSCISYIKCLWGVPIKIRFSEQNLNLVLPNFPIVVLIRSGNHRIHFVVTV